MYYVFLLASYQIYHVAQINGADASYTLLLEQKIFVWPYGPLIINVVTGYVPLRHVLIAIILKISL